MPTVMPLTDRKINTTKPVEKESTIFDGQGLYILISPISQGGAKRWHFRYTKPLTKKRTHISLGKYPYLTIEQARSLREDYRKLLAKNIDPQVYLAEKARVLQEERACTLEVVAKKWLEDKKKVSGITEDYAADIWSSLERYVLKGIGNMPIKEIGPKILKKQLEHAERVGVLETLKRVICRLNEIFRWAITEELVTVNPAKDLSKRFCQPKKKNLPALPPSELSRFLTALRKVDISEEGKLLIEWQLLTWVRSGEAVRARWSDIDMDKKIWSIPAEFMKMKKEHRIPLSMEAMEILDKMKSTKDLGDWVFPNKKAPGEHMYVHAANYAIRKMGFAGQLVAHGMRSIARTAAEESGEFRAEALEAALAHGKESKIVAAYNRSDYIEERVVIMQWWGDYVTRSKH